MFGKGNRIYSMFTGKCPKCHEGEMYCDKNPYHLTQTMKMHENCSHCGFQFQIEPNFFFGAMYVSYALSVATGILVFVLTHFFFTLDFLESFVAILVSLMLLMPVISRLARNIYINMLVSYDKSAGLSHRIGHES